MSNKKKAKTKASQPRSRTDTRGEQRTSGWVWAAVVVPIVGLLIVGVLGALDGEDDRQVDADSVAPTFDLPTTYGTRVSLEAVLDDGPALLFFSMGVGCDACFHQIPEIDQALADKGITLVPIMVESQEMVAAEAQRLGITAPILIDADSAVSESYDMLGIYGHQNTPTHSFALVDQSGLITSRLDYPSMFVPLENLLADLEI